MKIVNMRKMNQASEGGDNGGAAAQTSTPAQNTQGEGDNFSASLEQLYEPEQKPADESAKKTEQQPAQEAVKEQKADDGDAGSLSGYGSEPAKKTETPAEVKKDEQKPAQEEVKVEFNSEGLDVDSKTFVEKFAKDHKLTKEATQAFADQVKAQNKVIGEVADSYTKIQNERRDATHLAWENELKSDGKFGGANFKQSLKRVDKVLEELFPNAKNYLSTSKERLHPSAMKDLLSLYDSVLGGDNKVKHPQQGAKSDEFDIDDMYK